MVYATNTNEGIKKNVVDQLFWDARIDASHVKVEVNDGEVVLTGTVPDYTALKAAEEGAWALSGVMNVVNDLTIEYPPGVNVPSDDELKANVDSIIIWQPAYDTTDIRSSVKSGWVTLRGSVDAYWKKIRSEELVLTLNGVLGVTNELAVVPTKKIEDKKIADTLEAALERQSTLFVEDLISIQVDSGKVTLTGSVPSMQAFRSVQKVAQNTPGVREIDNKLALQ
jgi:osmotically-inducible protein OsmY